MRWPWQRAKYVHEEEMNGPGTAHPVEVAPPWVAHPNSGEPWGNWRQGEPEEWLLKTFLPFWNRLSREEHIAYVDKWDPPGAWREYLIIKWAHESICIHARQEDEDDYTDRCVGLMLGVVGVRIEPAAMRWYVGANWDGFGAGDDGFWIGLTDYDQFCLELPRLAALEIEKAVLVGTGANPFHLSFSVSDEPNLFIVEYLLSTQGKGGARRKHGMSGEYPVDAATFQQAIADIQSLRVDPERVRAAELHDLERATN